MPPPAPLPRPFASPPAAGEIEIRVLNPEGYPLGGAEVSLINSEDIEARSNYSMTSNATAWTGITRLRKDSLGTREWPHTILAISAPGYLGERRVFTTEEWQSLEGPLEFTLRKGRDVTVRIEAPWIDELPNDLRINASAMADAKAVDQVVTSTPSLNIEKGVYVFTVPPETKRVDFSIDQVGFIRWFAESIQLGPWDPDVEEEPLVWRIPKPGTVEISVICAMSGIINVQPTLRKFRFDENGRVIHQHQYSIKGEELVGDAAKFVFPDLMPGLWVFELRRGAWEAYDTDPKLFGRRVGLQVKEGETHILELSDSLHAPEVFAGEGRVLFRVLTATGEPVVGASWVLLARHPDDLSHGETHPVAEGTTDESGLAVVEKLAVSLSSEADPSDDFVTYRLEMTDGPTSRAVPARTKDQSERFHEVRFPAAE
jgi:hypothetical protein